MSAVIIPASIVMLKLKHYCELKLILNSIHNDHFVWIIRQNALWANLETGFKDLIKALFTKCRI